MPRAHHGLGRLSPGSPRPGRAHEAAEAGAGAALAVVPAPAPTATAATAAATAAANADANTNDARPNPPSPPGASLRVFKAFSSTTARRLEPSLQFLDAHIELQNVNIGSKIVTIISYPFIEGTHTAENVAQFVAIARGVLSMHSAGWCHSDVREANMVFARPAAGSRLIDFDFARNIAESPDARYPSNWNPTIDDGARHPAATAGAEMHFEHDVFALHAVMCLYEPAVAAAFDWNKWIALLNPTPAAEGQQPPPTPALLQAFVDAVYDSGHNPEMLQLRRKDQPSTYAASTTQADSVNYNSSIRWMRVEV